jgi:hypothetical protein
MVKPRAAGQLNHSREAQPEKMAAEKLLFGAGCLAAAQNFQSVRRHAVV